MAVGGVKIVGVSVVHRAEGLGEGREHNEKGDGMGQSEERAED